MGDNPFTPQKPPERKPEDAAASAQRGSAVDVHKDKSPDSAVKKSESTPVDRSARSGPGTPSERNLTGLPWQARQSGTKSVDTTAARASGEPSGLHRRPDGMPLSKDNPTKIIAENPNSKRNWDVALEKVFQKGSPEKNLETYRKEVSTRPSGSSKDVGTKQHYAAEKYNQVRQEYYKQEARRPSYDYTPREKTNLAKGNAPDYRSKTEVGTGEPGGPRRQLHHIEPRSKVPERALDPDNLLHVEGFQKGSSHHQMHHGEGAKRLDQWQQDVAAGRRPEAKPTETKAPADAGPRPGKPPEVKAPEVKPSEVKAPEVKPPSEPAVKPPEAPHPKLEGAAAPEGRVAPSLGGLAGKLLGVAGELLMIRDVAREIDFIQNPQDPKWGNQRTDMFGTTWYRNFSGEWSANGPLPEA